MAWESALTIQVPGGPALEGRLGLVADPEGGLLVCHPHPLYGGDMDNPVVVRAVEVAHAVALATLRFNFRGVGNSQGVHDHGQGEQEDVKAGLGLLASRAGPAARVGLAGHSFGAWVAARVAAAAPGPIPLALIAPPLGMFSFDTLDGYAGSVLLVAGSRDEFCSTQDLGRFAKRLVAPTTRIIEGADHLFLGKLFPLGEALREWIGAWARAG